MFLSYVGVFSHQGKLHVPPLPCMVMWASHSSGFLGNDSSWIRWWSENILALFAFSICCFLFFPSNHTFAPCWPPTSFVLFGGLSDRARDLVRSCGHLMAPPTTMQLKQSFYFVPWNIDCSSIILVLINWYILQRKLVFLHFTDVCVISSLQWTYVYYALPTSTFCSSGGFLFSIR